MKKFLMRLLKIPNVRVIVTEVSDTANPKVVIDIPLLTLAAKVYLDSSLSFSLKGTFQIYFKASD